MRALLSLQSLLLKESSQSNAVTSIRRLENVFTNAMTNLFYWITWITWSYSRISSNTLFMILVIRMKVILIRIFNYLIVPIAETDRICCVLESSECLFIKFVSKSIFFTIQPDFIQVFRIQVEKKEFILLSSPKIELVMSSNKSHIIACGKFKIKFWQKKHLT